MANINDFVSSFKDTELARPCNFDVALYPSTTLISTLFSPSITGKALQAALIVKGRDFKFRCESAELPSRTFGIVEQKTYGPIERTPIQNSYDPITLTFICSDDMSEKYFFDLWMEAISISNPLGLGLGIASSLLNTVGVDIGVGVRFDFQYKDNFTSTINITQYDLSGNPSYEVSLIEAFPYVVNQMPLNWNSNDNYHRVQVGFYYKYFMLLPV